MAHWCEAKRRNVSDEAFVGDPASLLKAWHALCDANVDPAPVCYAGEVGLSDNDGRDMPMVSGGNLASPPQTWGA